MKNNKHLQWIENYSKSSYQLFEGNILKAFAPIDFYHFFPLWYDLWVERIYQAIRKIQLKKKENSYLIYLPVPSAIRAVLQKLVIIYPKCPKIDKEKIKTIIDFFVHALEEITQEDTFSLKKNIIHKPDEIDDLINKTKLHIANPEVAREIGRLVMGLGALVNGLYNDVVTDMGWDSYGPYNLYKKADENLILLIRHFPNLRPAEIWEEEGEVQILKHKEIKIYTIYKGIDCRINWLGCHPTFDKSLTDSLVTYAVEVDGRFIERVEDLTSLKEYYLNNAASHYKKVKRMKFEELKTKALWQECYQLNELFNSINMDWRPDKQMIERVKNKRLLKNLYPLGEMIDYKTYCDKFGIRELKELYKNK
ncbi:MAG: hypothetical protein US81_C0001G0023 [Parcubacteria group bacterium GW2011_GWE2_38_18]|nr:MAG: hypothetical protein US81_C0001G0023 [Parcubacteria group bacterium GW2011_GWE2_38_18]